MIPIAEINKFSEEHGVPAETIEKDYVICWILKCLSSNKRLRDNFVFYGGTAIKRMHFEHHRFSEDIDLISENNLSADMLHDELINTLVQAKDWVNLAITVNRERTLSKDARTQIYAEYLGYDEIIGAPKEIRLDFAMDMNLYGEIEEGKLFQTYSDLKGEEIHFPAMTLNTILAGKLGLLMSSTRKEPRDLYDIWFLLNRLDEFDFELDILQRAFKQKCGFKASMSVLKGHVHNRLYKERWQIRLAKQISKLPDVESVMREIEQKLEIMLHKETFDNEQHWGVNKFKAPVHRRPPHRPDGYTFKTAAPNYRKTFRN